MAICLIVLMAAAAVLIFIYMRELKYLKRQRAAIAEQEGELQKRKNALELSEKQFEIEKRKVVQTVHVYASRTIEDPDNTAPAVPDKATYKKLASQFGYASYKNFKQCVVRQHEDGKTSFKLDLNVYPYYF